MLPFLKSSLGSSNGPGYGLLTIAVSRARKTNSICGNVGHVLNSIAQEKPSDTVIFKVRAP